MVLFSSRSISAIDFVERPARRIAHCLVWFYFIKANAAPASTIAGDQFVDQSVVALVWFFNRSLLAIRRIRRLRFACASWHFALVAMCPAWRRWLVWLCLGRIQ
jgi:hypothetical protein